MKRTAVLVDGSNAHASAQQLGFQIDYVKLLAYFKKRCDVTRALYFTALPPKGVTSTLRPMATFLDHNGYNVISKETKDYINHAGEKRRKGNMDCEIAIYATKYADIVEQMILFSGDGDFRIVVERVQELGCRVLVLSTLTGGMVADALRRQADEFIELDGLRAEIEHIKMVTTQYEDTRAPTPVEPKRKRFFT